MDGKRAKFLSRSDVVGAARVQLEDELLVRVAEQSAQIHALMAALAATMAEVVEAGLWEQWGLRSPAHWLTLTGGWSLPDAHRLCRVAAHLDDLGPVAEMGARGEVPLRLLDDMALIATPDTVDELAHLAATCTTPQAQRVLSTYRSVVRSSTEQPDPPARPDAEPELAEDELWWRQWTDGRGRGRIDAALSPVVAELIAEAYAAAAADTAPTDPRTTAPAAHGSGGEADAGPGPRVRPPRTGRAADDVVRRMAQGALGDVRRSGTRRTAGEPFTVLVTVDVATLARALGLDDAHGALGAAPLYRLGSATFTRSGKRLSDGELRRLLPDSVLQVLVTADGLPLWMGAEERFANRHQRRALLVRGHGRCEVPGCTNSTVLRAHHVVEACERGPTCLCNLLHPCAPHHRQLHAQGWRIETEPGSQRFTLFTADGRCLGSTHPDGRPPDLDGPRRVGPRGAPPVVAPDATTKTGGGEPLTRYALDVFLSELLGPGPGP